MNTVQPRNLRGASLRSTSLFRSSAWDAHSRRKPRGNGILQSLLASTMVTRVEMDEVVVTCNERARDGNVEHACARSWNARCTLARRNRPERLPGRRRRSPLVVGSPPRRLCPTTLSRFEPREKWVEKLYGVWSADHWAGTGRKCCFWSYLRRVDGGGGFFNNRSRRESIIVWKILALSWDLLGFVFGFFLVFVIATADFF